MMIIILKPLFFTAKEETFGLQNARPDGMARSQNHAASSEVDAKVMIVLCLFCISFVYAK